MSTRNRRNGTKMAYLLCLDDTFQYTVHAVCNSLINNTLSIDLLKVLDPIDGTRGFLKGDDALYVVCLLTLRLSFPCSILKCFL